MSSIIYILTKFFNFKINVYHNRTIDNKIFTDVKVVIKDQFSSNFN